MKLVYKALKTALVFCIVFSLSSCGTADLSSAKPTAAANTQAESYENTVTQKFSAHSTESSPLPTASAMHNANQTASSPESAKNQVSSNNSVQNAEEHTSVSGSSTEHEITEDAAESSNQSDGSDPKEPERNTCTFTIDCKNALMSDKLSETMRSILPADGIIYSATVEFTGGESVFDILSRITRQNNISMEFSYTPGFNSYYVEGINSLRELDCGSESGWMYKVNDTFPNYGCSSYTVSSGDNIGFYYTVTQGEDLK